MTTEHDEPSTEELQAKTALARWRVAADVAQLHAELKHLEAVPQRVVQWIKQHKAASVGVGVAALLALLGWRTLAHKRA